MTTPVTQATSHWLLDRLRRFGEGAALTWRRRTVTYRELADGVESALAELDGAGVAPGAAVALLGDYAPDTCRFLLALASRGSIAVPLTSAAAGNRERLMEIARVGWACDFEAGAPGTPTRRPGAGDHPLYGELRARGSAGVVLFTSGSTGDPKGVLLDMDRLLARFERRRRPRTTLVFLLMDHIGGLNTLFYVLTSGGTLVTAGDRSPRQVCAAIERHRVQLLPTSPTFLNMLLISGEQEAFDLSSLELVTYGTEPMPASTLRSLGAALPGVELKQTYGLSEVGILPTRSPRSDSLWFQLGEDGFETKVVDGKLWIRAETAMLGYLNAPSPFDADGWMSTGDEVQVEGDLIRVLGRTTEVVNVGGEKVYPAEVESALLELDNVLDATVRGKPNPITGQVVVAELRLERPEEPAELRRRVRRALEGRLEPYKIPMLVEVGETPGHSGRFKKVRS